MSAILIPETRVIPELTLLDLMSSVSEVTSNDAEAVAIVCGLIETGRIRLVGEFRASHVFVEADIA